MMTTVPKTLRREQQTKHTATVRVAPVTVHGEDAVTRARAIASTLRSVRSGKLGADAAVDGIVLLERITQSKDGGSTFFHLSQAARNSLIAGGCLPWGA